VCGLAMWFTRLACARSFAGSPSHPVWSGPTAPTPRPAGSGVNGLPGQSVTDRSTTHGHRCRRLRPGRKNKHTSGSSSLVEIYFSTASSPPRRFPCWWPRLAPCLLLQQVPQTFLEYVPEMFLTWQTLLSPAAAHERLRRRSGAAPRAGRFPRTFVRCGGTRQTRPRAARRRDRRRNR
jgi:hypothetical protein